MKNLPGKRMPVITLQVLSLLVFWFMTINVKADAPVSLNKQLEIGRRIYELGLLPDNTPLRAQRAEGFEISGEAAACITCHRRSGMGSVEGNLQNTILVPPIAGPILFAPSRFSGTFLDSSHYYIPNAAWARVLTRSAYNDQSLARALREGIDPDGKPLIPPMMHYQLGDAALAALSTYLKSLATEAAPGVESDTLHLAVVVSPEASQEQTEAVLAVLRAWSRATRVGGRTWTLHEWRLTGAPFSWNNQLSDHYRHQAVFALLSGIGLAHWEPVHRFCEQNRVPCVLPSTEVIPPTNDGYYSVYFSPGVNLEARILANHLASPGLNHPQADGKLIQVFADATGQQATQMLQQAFSTAKRPMINQRYYLTAPRAALRDAEKNDTLILWLRPAQILQLAAEFPQGLPVQRVYLSALLAAPERLTLPPAWHSQAAWVSLFDDMSVQNDLAQLRLTQWLQQRDLPQNQDLRLQADAYVASYLFQVALMEMVSQEHRRPPVPPNREHFLETLENLINKYGDGTSLVDPDSHVAFYGRMSLGPRQRVAVRGGTVLRYRDAHSNELVPVGERIVPGSRAQ